MYSKKTVMDVCKDLVTRMLTTARLINKYINNLNCKQSIVLQRGIIQIKLQCIQAIEYDDSFEYDIEDIDIEVHGKMFIMLKRRNDLKTTHMP